MTDVTQENTMIKEGFDLACARYGADMAVWPDDVRAQADAYVKTAEGKCHHLEMSGLDNVFKAAMTATAPQDASASFMARLARIPAEYVQREGGLTGWLRQLLLPGFDGLGLRILAQQVAVFAIVLGLGVAAGFSGVRDTQENVDISDGWLALTIDIEHEDDGVEG